MLEAHLAGVRASAVKMACQNIRIHRLGITRRVHHVPPVARVQRSVGLSAVESVVSVTRPFNKDPAPAGHLVGTDRAGLLEQSRLIRHRGFPGGLLRVNDHRVAYDLHHRTSTCRTVT